MISISGVDADSGDDIYQVTLGRQLNVGEEITVYVEFSYKLLSSPKNGLHWNDYPENGAIK